MMKFRVGTKVCVKNVYSGGNFENGDVVTIVQIGDGDGDDECYGQYLYMMGVYGIYVKMK